MTKINYIALLRGINVGGKNIIKMADLKACFEKSGLENVATYIQSGNVLFETAAPNPIQLLTQLEVDLSRTFPPYQARLVLCSHSQLQQIVASAPAGFGSQPEQYRYDVFFLRQSLTAAETVKQVPTKVGVDELWAGPGVIYFARLMAQASQSQLNKLIGLPIYQEMTIRNWNTTSKLLALLDKR
jgi:uncharacterized protein (DUF1697 family)